MLKGIDENGELRNVKLTEEGELLVKQAGGGSGATTTTIDNTSENPVPVNVISGDTVVETTLSAGVITASTTATSIAVNKKVTEISIANYSETANVTLTIGTSNFVVGSNVATDFPIGKNIGSLSITATEADTKVQYVIKGEE